MFQDFLAWMFTPNTYNDMVVYMAILVFIGIVALISDQKKDK